MLRIRSYGEGHCRERPGSTVQAGVCARAPDPSASLYRQVISFLSVGGLAAGVSYGVYLALVFIHLATMPARAIGFVMGSLISFAGNRRHTFADRQSGPFAILAHGGLYGGTLGLNVMMNEVGLYILGSQSVLGLTIACIFATACSSTANFFGLKLFVFRAEPLRQLSSPEGEMS